MKYTWLLGLEQARRVYRELGRRLVAAGHLKAVDDVFWLRQDEVRAWAETGAVTWTQATLESREREWRGWGPRRPPPLVIRGPRAPGAAPPTPPPPPAHVPPRPPAA